MLSIGRTGEISIRRTVESTVGREIIYIMKYRISQEDLLCNQFFRRSNDRLYGRLYRQMRNLLHWQLYRQLLRRFDDQLSNRWMWLI